MINSAQQKGYYVTILYFWLNSPDIAVERVADRVLAGGHNVPEETIRKYGVYSAETAAAMAEACRAAFRTDIGVGITGSFGNIDPCNTDSVPGEVYFAVAAEKGTETFHCRIPVQISRFAYKMYMADVIADCLARETERPDLRIL